MAKRTESIWKTRWDLFLKSSRTNWELFKERKIAIFGLAVIILFGVFGALYPAYKGYMNNRYVRQLDEIAKRIYSAYEENLQEAFLQSRSDIDYTLKVQSVSNRLEKEIDDIFKVQGMNAQNTFRDSVQDAVEGYFDYNARKAMFDYIKDTLRSSKNVNEAAEKIAKYFYAKKIENFINDTGVYEKSQIVWKFLDREKIEENLKKWARSDPVSFAKFLTAYQIYYKPDDIEKRFDEIMRVLRSKASLDVFPLLASPEALDGAVKTKELKSALLDTDVLYYISLVYDLGMSKEEIEKKRSDLAEMFAESPDFDTYSQAILQKEIAEMFTKSREDLEKFLESMVKGHIKLEIVKNFDFNYIAKERAVRNSLEFFDEKFPQLVGLWKLLDESENAYREKRYEKLEEALGELSRRLSTLTKLKGSVAIIGFWVDSLEGGNCGYKDGEQRIGLNFRNIDSKLAPYLSGIVQAIFKVNGGKLRAFAQKIQDTLSSSKKASSEEIFQKMSEMAKGFIDQARSGKKPDFKELEDMLSRYYLTRSEDEELSKTLSSVRNLLREASEGVVVYDLHYLAEFFSGKIESYLGKGEFLSEVQSEDNQFKEILKGKKKVEDINKLLTDFNELIRQLVVKVASLDLKDVRLTSYYRELTESLVNVYDQYLNTIKNVLSREGLNPTDSVASSIIKSAAFIELYEVSKAYFFSSKPYDPITGNDGLLSNPARPSPMHPFGTDPLGRDVLSQMMYSTPREFILGVTAAFITVFIGTIIGATSAYYGGAVDTFFMRLADIIMLFPSLPLLMVLSAFIELTLFKLALIIGVISGFGSITIVLKSQALTVKVRPFIEAAKSAGGSDWYIIRRHIVPNILPLSFLYMMFSVTGAIFTEAVLSFFGLVNIKMSWGIILYTASSQGYLIGTNIGTFWWLWVPAGVAITLICSAFYFLGRGLEEIVNPRLRKR